MIKYDTLISKRQTRIKEDERIYCTVETKIISYIKMLIASYNFYHISDLSIKLLLLWIYIDSFDFCG